MLPERIFVLNILRTAKGYSKLSLIFLAYVAFIALGMPDGLLGVAWPSIRADFFIPLDFMEIFGVDLILLFVREITIQIQKDST